MKVLLKNHVRLFFQILPVHTPTLWSWRRIHILGFDFVVAFTHGSWVLRLIREMKFPQQGLNKILKYSRHN